MSSLTTAVLSGIGLVLTGFWFGAAYGYRCRQYEEAMERWRALSRDQASQSDYAEWMLEYERERRR